APPTAGCWSRAAAGPAGHAGRWRHRTPRIPPRTAGSPRRPGTSACAAAAARASARLYPPAARPPPRRTGAPGSRSFGAPEAQPRVEHRGEHVRDERGDQVYDADDEDAGLQHPEVFGLRGLEDEIPDPLVVEQRLHYDEPPDQVAGLGGDDGDR